MDKPLSRAVISEVMRRFAGQRTVAERACTVCGKVFRGTKRARYCGAACSSKAARRRRGQKT